MNISCKQYQTVQARIQGNKQSNPKSIVKPEESYNPTQSTKGFRVHDTRIYDLRA